MAGDDNMAIARFRGNLVPAPKNAVVKIMQYLLHTKNWGITFSGLDCFGRWGLPGYKAVGVWCSGNVGIQGS